MARLRQDLTLGILHDDAPGELMYLYPAIIRTVDNAISRLRTLPHGTGTFLLETVTEHHVVLIRTFRLDRRRQHADTGCPRRDELHLDLQLGVIHVSCIGEIEHLHSYRPVAVQVKGLSGRQSVTLPLHQSLTLLGIETHDGISQEISVREVIEIR